MRLPIKFPVMSSKTAWATKKTEMVWILHYYGGLPLIILPNVVFYHAILVYCS